MRIVRKSVLGLAAGLAFLMLISELALAADAKKPNILVIWGDDIGQTNISANTRGLVGYQTPKRANYSHLLGLLEGV